MLRDQDAHIRALLDARQPRFSALSDYSDAPSLYTPRPHDLPPSVLDLDQDDDNDDDEPRPPFPYDHPTDDTPAPARLSYLGPKMRFHSRAPWELDDGDLDELDDPDDSPRHFGGTFPFARRRPSGSASPRPSFQTTRPSGESSRSQVLPKRSFDTSISQISYPRGALYALAHESMSATSLGQVNHPPRETLRSKFSLGRLRPDTPTDPLPPPPVPPISPAHSRFPPSSPTFDNRPREIHSAPTYEATHPYANPELVVTYSNDSSSTYHSSLGSHYASSRNDSNLTVTEAFSTDSIAKSSSQATLTPDSSINSITSKPRSSAILAKNISSPVPVVINAPDLSASDRSQDHSTHGLPPGVSNLAGWTERNAAPAFSLISLEEARAQRMRSTTSIEASRNSSSSGSRASSAFPGEENETSTANTSQSSDGSPFGRARGRSVSTGSKAKSALQTIVGSSKGDRRDSEAPTSQPASSSMAASTGGRSLKHKKSGFMRLFNGGKLQEKEERDDPPPVPSLPEQHIGSNVSSAPQRAPKSVQRIPVPSLSPSLYEVASVPSTDSVANESATSESPSWKVGLNSRRMPPALSIRTMPPGPISPSARASVSAAPDSRINSITNNSGYASPVETPESGGLNTRRPWATADSQPQSAPAHVSEFPALRLRPMSTLFSEHFSEHIVVFDDAQKNDQDKATPPMAPLTPPASALSSSGGGQSVLEAGASEKQRQIWDLEGQVRDLKAELEEIKGRHGDKYCSYCGRGNKAPALLNSVPSGSVVNRPRARTGTSSRFTNAMP
ncbi:hypothetical protein BDN70DRAFT_935726 [Pholiota conissans]|uniref:Uncharacterized protein n=1 Tax=Pholiota conissans TaxID=109636 RepID=A0A9P5YTS0_9AGAR|nr:hypothetical protein BDN70DRAFT_935726 [Pholiota conissans]